MSLSIWSPNTGCRRAGCTWPSETERPPGAWGLRKLDERNCEMKRLYVRPQYRGARIGERLARQVIDDARAIGYAHMLLDTFPFLESAIRMYRALGFYEVERYNDNPIEGCIYMKLDL